MTKYENECVGCPQEIGCLGTGCPNRKVKHLYCDECHADCEELYLTDDNQELCLDCLLSMFDTITL